MIIKSIPPTSSHVTNATPSRLKITMNISKTKLVLAIKNATEFDHDAPFIIKVLDIDAAA